VPRYSHEDFKNAKRAMTRRFLAQAAPPDNLERFALSAAVSVHPRSNLVGVGIGPKISAGKQTATRAVRFYVERKVPPASLSEENRLPSDIDGIPTDVLETGRFRLLSTASDNKLRRRPARPGSSIGFKIPPPKDTFLMAGTFGAVVDRNGARFILSNNHVLAGNGAVAIGAPIFQPGLLDGGRAATDQIAALSQFVKVGRTGAATVDCAIAEILAAAKVSAQLMPAVGSLNSASPIAAKTGMKVEKTGRTTGYTRGSVFDIQADITVQFEDPGGQFDAVFTDQIIIRGDSGLFSDRGDSGSLIVDRATKRATGLLFAGSPTHTIANHIAVVLQALGVSLEIG
jgi:hypothetical protein